MVKTHNSYGDNYTSITRNNGNGTQTEKTFNSRTERQEYLRTERNENRPSITHQTRVVERTGSDED